MHRLRELIHSPHFPDLIPIFTQILQIPCQGRRVTAYIHNFFRLHLHDRLKQRLITAFSRRIYYDHIRTCLLATMSFSIFFIIVRQNFFCLSNIERCIIDLIDLRIILCIFDCLRHDLNSIDLLCLLCKEERNCSDTAIQIPYSFRPFQICIFQCKSVQFFSLHRIHLIKGQRRNLILYISNIICDKSLSPQYFIRISHDDVIPACIRTERNTCHSFKLSQFFNQPVRFR